jgi:hypothetical protein
MPTTEVNIYNEALLLNGQQELGPDGLSEASTERIYCSAFYDSARKEVLKVFDWAFARKNADLVVDESEESAEWEYVYEEPTENIRVLSVEPEDGVTDESNRIKFEPMGVFIYTNEGETPWCKYTHDCDDPTLFDDMFASAVAHRLAAYISMPIHRDKAFTNYLYGQYRAMLSLGSTADANEGHNVPVVGQTFINARRG